MWAVTVIDACPIVFLEEPQIGARPSREGGINVPKVVDAKSGPPDLQNYLPHLAERFQFSRPSRQPSASTP